MRADLCFNHLVGGTQEGHPGGKGLMLRNITTASARDIKPFGICQDKDTPLCTAPVPGHPAPVTGTAHA
jgi:hypothetical protein